MTTSKWIKDESGYTRYLSLEIFFQVLSCDFILWEFHTRLWWNSKGKTHDWRQTVNFYTNSYDIDLCFKMSHIYFDRVNENNSKKAESKVCFMVLLLFCLFVCFHQIKLLSHSPFSYSSSWGDKGREDAGTFTSSLISFVLYLLQHFSELMGDLVTLG